jgi:hypothetical protein
MNAEILETLRETGGANERRTTCTKQHGERMSAETLGTVREDVEENTNMRRRNGGRGDARVGQVLQVS